MKLVNSISCSLFLLILMGTFFFCKIQKNINKKTTGNFSTYEREIILQDRKNFIFNNGDLIFSNKFLSGRLDRIEQIDDSSFNIFIKPENKPINLSPWYAFKIWSKYTRNVFINLNYYPEKHRYDPKISTNDISWERLQEITLNYDSTVSTFKLEVNSDTTTIAAQEIINSSMSNKWVDNLAELNFMRKHIIGYSLMGKPIVAITNNESSGKNIVVVISRQHPPEVTGYLAMQEFVQTLTSSSRLARQFRKKFEIIVVPMVNPDGVDEGNWRHSLAGVDLNRDWENFKQPETRSVKDFILKKVSDQKAKVYFALDFHSTWYDILYINSDTLTNIPGLTKQWITGFENKLGVPLKSQTSGNGGNVSKSWFNRELNADALTYEVGDNTSREMLKKKGSVAAEVLMNLLIMKIP